MGNTLISAIPRDVMTDLNLDYSRFPPRIMIWPALFMDMFCNLLHCRDTWRSYLPFGLADEGAWFSEEFSSDGIVDIFVKPLTFEQFQESKGFEVIDGSGMFAGYQDFSQWSKSAFEFMFQTSSTAFSNLFTPTALLTVALLVLVLKAVKAVVMPRFRDLGRSMALRTHGDAWVAENEDRIVKFGEYVFRLCYHSTITLVGIYCFWDAPWWTKEGTPNLYKDFPKDPVSPKMAWYYLLQAAYNCDALISLLELSFQIRFFSKNSVIPISIGWSDTVRGDFNEMLAHHFVTNALVFLSSFFAQTRIGAMVFWIHDISDVPVDLCKLANFVKWKAATVILFFLLVISWAYFRLWILPARIWKSIYLESWSMIYAHEGMKVFFYAFQPLFLVLVGTLVLLHVVWFSMFIKMMIVLVTKGETHDLSEHKGGEKQDVPHVVKAHTNGHGKKKN